MVTVGGRRYDRAPEAVAVSFAAIHTVARGESLLSPVISPGSIEAFVQRPPDGTRTPPPGLQQLTPGEAGILRLIARGSARTPGPALFLSRRRRVGRGLAVLIAKPLRCG